MVVGPPTLISEAEIFKFSEGNTNDFIIRGIASNNYLSYGVWHYKYDTDEFFQIQARYSTSTTTIYVEIIRDNIMLFGGSRTETGLTAYNRFNNVSTPLMSGSCPANLLTSSEILFYESSTKFYYGYRGAGTGYYGIYTISKTTGEVEKNI